MKILVTGASGLVGSVVARELLEQGHELRVLDRELPAPDIRQNVEMVYADIADRFAVLRAFEGIEGVAHLAAIPNPGAGEAPLIGPNIAGTFHILEACEAFGVQRCVLASTCAIYGLPFSHEPIEFLYLPIDEEHPMRASDLYAVSKQTCETMAAMVSRRSKVATTCLRINRVINPTGRRMRWARRMLESAHTRPDADLWHYIHAHDVARAFRLALEKVTEGHHRIQLVSRDLLTDKDPRELLEMHYPNLVRFLDGYDPSEMGFWNTRRAEILLGFVPERSWREMLD